MKTLKFAVFGLLLSVFAIQTFAGTYQDDEFNAKKELSDGPIITIIKNKAKPIKNKIGALKNKSKLSDGPIIIIKNKAKPIKNKIGALKNKTKPFGTKIGSLKNKLQNKIGTGTQKNKIGTNKNLPKTFKNIKNVAIAFKNKIDTYRNIGNTVGTTVGKTIANLGKTIRSLGSLGWNILEKLIAFINKLLSLLRLKITTKKTRTRPGKC